MKLIELDDLPPNEIWVKHLDKNYLTHYSLSSHGRDLDEYFTHDEIIFTYSLNERNQIGHVFSGNGCRIYYKYIPDCIKECLLFL